MDDKKQYIIQIPGEEHVAYWNEEKYGLNEEELFKNYPNAQVTEMTMADPRGDIADDDQFAISIPGESHVAQWDGKKLAANRDQLLEMYPDAQVSRLSNVTAQRDADFVQRYEDATNVPSMENARFIHDNEERYNTLMAKYTQPEVKEEKSGSFLKGAKQSIMGAVGGLMNAFAENLRSLRIARFGQFADDTLWNDANKEFERRVAAGEPLFRNDVEPSTAEKAGWTKDDARAYARSKQVNALINRLQKQAEERGENPDESVRASLNRQVETSDTKIIQDAANKIIENNSTPMKGWGKVGAMIPLAGTSAAAVGLAATGNYAAAAALGEATMATFAGSAAGSAMKQARDAGANTAQANLAGLATAGIFYGIGQLPLNRALNGVISSSAARSVAGVPWQGVEKELDILLTDAVKNGLIVKEMEKGAGKILAKEFFKNWGAQIASHTTSFAAMSAMQAMVPLIYEDPDKYPVLANVLQSAKEGAIDGLMLGAIVGGFSSGSELAMRSKRWEGRKSVNIAEVQFDQNRPPEVLEYDSRSGRWIPSEDLQFGTAYFAEVVGVDNSAGRPLSVLINDGGRMKMVRMEPQDVRSMRSIGLEKAKPEAENAYREQGFEQGRLAETGEQREAVRNEQKYLEAKSQAEEQSGGVSEGTRLDLERANAAMEGRRESVRHEILQRTGNKQFWIDSTVGNAPDENGMRPVTHTVHAITLKDGRQIFVTTWDEKGYTYVDETGRNGFLDKNSPEIASYDKIPLDDYIDSRVKAQDAQAEQQRMQAEHAQNIGKIEQALIEHGEGKRINLGTQEEENWVPIIGMDMTPNGGIVIKGESGAETMMPWREVASRLGVPIEPKTSDDLVQERLSADAQVNKYNGIPQGAELQVPIEGAEPMIYKFRSAELVEGDIIIRAEDPMSGDVVDLTPDIINNLDVLTEKPQPLPDGVTYGPVLETQQRKNGTTVEIRAKTETKNGISTTTAIGMRDGAEVGMPTAFMPMPEGLQIKEDYMSIFEDEEGKPRNGVELLGVHEVREGDNGAGQHVIGATIVVRDENGVTTYDVALERTTPPAEDVSTQIFDDPAANQLGITKDYAFTTKGGRTVVNGRKLWDENPRLWAKWNDANPDRNVTTKDFLESKMQGINAEVSKARTNLEMEAKGNQDPDKLLELREKLNGKELRRQEVQTLLDEYIAAEKALQEAAEAEERARKEAEDAAKAAAFQAELEAQRQERERKEAEHQVLMSQDEAFRARTEEYQAAPKYVGRATKVNVGGQEYPAHFVLMDAGTPLTSHDPLNNFTPTEGFGVDEQGRNLNTRAYDKEVEEQEGARAIGRHPDYRLIEYMPVVTYEGRAVSGNKRLSGRKLAAADGTDADLIKEYRDAREQFDFTDEQLAEFEHPVIVKQLDEPVPYTAKFFDAFNQSIGTAASTVALAAKVAKMTDEVLINRVANLFVGIDDIQKVYQNPEAINSLFNILEAEKISPREDRPRYIDAEGKLTGAGEDFVESLLFGSIFSASDEAVRLAMADKSIRRAVAFAFPTLVRTRNLKGEYSIIKEMTDAVTILAQAKADNQGKPEGAIEYYLLQPDLFTGETPVVAATTQLLARVLNDKKYGSLRKVLDQYIPRAELANEGQLGFNFDGEEGVLETKEDILSDVLKQNNIDIQTYGRTEAAAAEPELPANDEVYPPSGEYGGGRAEIERPAVESAGGLQAEGNTAAEVAARDAEVAGRIADILSGKDTKRYKPSYEYDSGVNVPDKFIDEVSRQWDEHKSAVEAQRKPLQKRVSELVDSFQKGAEAGIKAKNPNVGETTLHNASIDIVDRKIKDSQEYQDLVKQIDALDEQVSPKTKDRFRQNAIGMLYADYAEAPTQNGLDQLFSMLGTTREQAYQDRLQVKLSDIDQRIKANPEQKATLMEERTAAIQEFIDANVSVDGIRRVVTTEANLPSAMTEAGYSPAQIQKVETAIAKAALTHDVPRSFIYNGGIFVITDNIKSAKSADTAHAHEEEHFITNGNGDADSLLKMEGASRKSLLNAIDSWVGYVENYHDGSDSYVANEFISHAIERAKDLPEDEQVKMLAKAGINSEEIVNLVKNRVNERRNRSRELRAEAGRRSGTDAHDLGGTPLNAGQDGGNPQEGAGSRLDIQRPGSADSGLRGNTGGEIAAAERRAAERTPQYKPAEERRLRAVDSLGSPKPEVISEIGKDTTEGTALFSLDKDDKTLVGIHNIDANVLGKAIRMGGLANPSAAVIDLSRQNHFDYGDVSLIMPASLVDKSSGENIGTYDRDAWTPTYPTIKYFESKQSRERLKELIKDLPKDLQYDLSYKVEGYLNGDIYNSGLEYLFLKEKGMEIGMQTKPRRYPYATVDDFMANYLKAPGLKWGDSSGFMDAYRALSEEDRLKANVYMTAYGNPDSIQKINERIENYSKKYPAFYEGYSKEKSFADIDSFLYTIMRDERDAGEESTGLTIEKAIEVIKEKGLQEEFGHWQDKVIESLGFDEKFFDGYTPSGNRRYKAHTLENVSAWMKKQGRNASKDHGLVMTSGTIMAKMAKKFTSLTQIRRAKSRLVPSGEAGKEYQEKIDDVRERIKNLVISFWSDKLSRQSGLLTGELVALDYVQDFLILGKDLDSVVKNYNETEHENLSLSEEEKAAFNTLREDIRNLPVHYFETKFERPVYLDEFAAAVVPTDTPADIKEQLKNDGLSVFEYDRNDKDSRRQAVIEASKGDGIMFSFMGTVGAARLDAAEGREDRLSDLYFARQMDGTRDPHAIKLATGWEKGLDGKWRYEKRDFKEYDPDGNIQYKKRHPELARYEELLGKSNKALFFPEENEPLTETEQTEFNKLSAIYGRKPGDWTGKGWKTPYHNSSKLPDYIDDEELFTAYPELRDTRVKFEKLPDDTGGYFSMEKNTLVMNENERYHRTRAEDIIIHEIQHKIQDIEGFSAGTNMEEAKRKANLEQPKRNLLDNNQKEFMRSVKLWMGNSMAWKQSVPLASYLGQVSSRIGEDYYKSNLEGKNENDVLREYNRLVVLNNSAQRLTPMEIYAATSGEVEARNVERRRRIGFQDTRRVLAEETEDIARKDQILNMPEYDLLDVDGLTESLKTAQQKTNKVPGSKAMSIELDDDVNLMQTTDNQAAKDLASRYDNQDGDKYPWMSEGELIDAIEKELPYGKDTKPVFALIDEYRRLDAEDFEEGRRDFSGGEKQDLFEKITGELRSLGDKQETVMFSLTRNNKTVIDSWLKKRSDLKEEDRAAVMEYLEELNDSRTQLAAGRWFAAGTIRLPEDMPKVEQAISVAGKAKVDPLKYDSPMALLDAHADFKPTEKRIDPNTVNTLHKVKEFNEQGIVIYDVDDSEESRQNMRQIINTHYGKDASPWCLLQGDGEGNLTEDSKYYWGVYNAYPKQVAFKDGKLLAFSANDDKTVTWWDRQDSPHNGIPVDRKIPNDELGRSATYELDADGLLANPTNIHKGNKQNGAYTEWFGLGEDNISLEENYIDGRLDGKRVLYRENGLVKAEEYYDHGNPVGDQLWYYANGNIQSRGTYDQKGRLLRSESFFDDGKPHLLINYQDGKRHGLTKEWYENGNPFHSSYWVNGQREGVHEAYFKDGKLRERSEYKNGKLNGVEEDWNEKGILIARIEYKDGQRHGRTMLYYNGGQPYEEKYYVNGLANGTYRHWEADGTLTNEYNYKDNHLDGLQKRFWWATGRPLEFSNYKDSSQNGVTKAWGQEGKLLSMTLYENGRQVRDLLAEGVTEEDADNLNFSFVTDEKELERLEKEPTVTLYRAMAQIDGKLYPPMSTKEPNGPGQKGRKLKLRQPSELGRWERSDEAPDKAKQGKDGKWYFDLKKGNGGDVNGVLYNPYFHTSASPLNDQFSGAINYPELVTVAVEVPISEFSSGYKADKANDTVGPKDWHSGTVTGQLGEGRQVVLTRWAKPTRIVPDSEVASIIAPKLIDKKIVVPSNVVTPTLKAELEKRGVVFDGKPEDYEDKTDFALTAEDKRYLEAVKKGDMETAQKMVSMAARRAFPESAVVDEFYTPKVVLHGTKSDFRAFDPNKIGTANDAGWLGRGFYFYGNNPIYASQYANFNNPNGGRVIKAFLNIENPYWASVEDFERLAEQNSQEASEEFTQQLKEDGYDGVYYNGDGNEEWVAFYPEQIKSAEPITYDAKGNIVPLSERFNETTDDIYFSLVNENQEVFVSNAAKAVEGIKNDKATPEQWLKQLEKNGGLKAGEDKWIGLSDWLKSQDKKSLTKQEVLDYINENKIQIEETHYTQDNPEVEKALEKYNREMQSYMQDPDEAYEWADRQLAEFYEEMESKYGEDFLNELTESERVAEEQLLQQRDDALNMEPEYDAFQQMVNKYGDDFNQAFSLSGNELEINMGFDDEPDPAAMYFLRLEGVEGNPINNTRLEYTTKGLNNNHEIALTVPTIEPWNEGDSIHFGDAGEGRAIAWIRFGETTVSGDKRVLVIDEIQSKRHQEGREKGYKDEELETKANRHNELSRKFYSSEGLTLDEHKEFRALQDEFYAIGSSTIEKNRKAIPAAPFEKNWHELAMKRMFRYAAENGYDAIAWTTGDQQADRYNIGKVVNKIEAGIDVDGNRLAFVSFREGGTLTVHYDDEGNITKLNGTYAETMGQAKHLSDIVGKEIAKDALTVSERGSANMKTYEGEGLRLGAEGMKGFYDDILPRFMNKYGKKWGVSVKDMELPIGEVGKEVMHSVPVTEEMKESVMEGQPMFSMVEGDKKGLPINDFYATIDSMFGDENFKPAEHSRERYNLGETPGWMKKVGLSGENFSLPFKSIREHKGKDSDHALTADEWKRLPDAVKNPFLVTKYKGADDRFRLYTGLLHNGKFVAVGVDVIPVNQGKDAPILEVNRIKTAFGVNGGLSQNEKIVAYDDKITPEQEALLRGLNYREYPTIQELSTTNVENNNEFTSISEKNNNISYSMVKSVENKGKTGFAEVMGGKENLDELYDKIYRAIPRDILAPVVERAMNDGFNVRKHVDAYLHDLAKNGTENDETGLLRALYSEVRAYAGNPELTDGDIRYMIYKATSYAKDGDMLSTIEDIAMRRRWGAGEDKPLFSMQRDFADATDEAREKLDAKLTEADEAEKTAVKNLRNETMKAIRENDGQSFKSRLLPISKAMSAQKTYDRATVDGIVKFAKEILKNGNVDSLTFRETNRLLALVASANGKSPAYATRYSEQLLDLLLDHIVKKETADFNALVNVKDKTTNQKGVEVLGEIDLRGQETMKAFRDSRKLTEEEMENRLLDISERMNDPSDAVRSHAFAEYEGVMLAQQYQNGLGENLKEADDLMRELEYEKEAKKTGNIDKKAYDEYVRSTNEAIRENKMERVDLYRNFGKRLSDIISTGSSRAKAFREANRLRVEAIQHDANRDMKGISTKEHRSDSRVDRLINSDAIRFLFKPLATFDQMLRVIGRRNMSGEGYLWNRFMRGWVDAAERSYDGLFKATDELDKKASEVFGKKMRWSEIYDIERKMPKTTVKFMDGGDPVEHELTAGNLLYIYMVDKMVDGRMKLRKMGIDESMVQEIKNNLDPRFIQLADWVQEDFLVRMRNKYNEVHERMFGAPMADIQDYFPLKILANARIEEVDLGNRPDGNPLSSTTTGSIIKRRKNSLALDLLHTDAFSLVIEHLQQMEDWAAFAEYRRDLNSLLSYKRFRNQLQNMRTIYGTGKSLWSNFKDVASMASGSYKPKVGKGDVDTVVLNISKGVTAAKINFRVNTALKQLLSAPAYLAEANIGDLAKSLAKPGASWNWCMENLPVFKKRWKSHLAGDTRLMDTESDWEIWRKNAVKTAGRLGMAPNAFVDAATVAIGAKAMYDTKYRRYIESGYSETAADRRAKQDATILYNQTQQSNENPFVSPMQLDRTMLSVMLTTFRNASMGYQRQLHDAIRGLGREFDDMSKQERIDFMAEQGKNAGADEEQAKTGAEKEYGRQKWRNLVRIAIFGFGLQFLWNLGADIWYEIFGDDEKKKKKTLWNAALKMLAGPIEGLAGGNIISDAWGIISSGQSLRNIGFGELPIVSDAKTILQELEYDQPAAVNDVINLIAQSATGVNPETITDIAVAVIDACNGDLGTAKEVALLMMRIAQIPQSTIDEFFIDEIGMSAKKAKRLNPSELAKRYAEYKMNKNAPLTQGLYDEKTEARRRKSYEKKFKDKVKERK